MASLRQPGYEVLRNVPLFATLTDSELKSIVEKVILRKYRKNDVIFHEEDTNEVMYIILSGKVKVVQTSEEGKEIILALHKSGDFFGEMSLIDGKTAPATVMAIENAIIAIISKKDFHTVLSWQPKVLLNLLQIFCTRLRDSYSRIQILSFNNAAQRIKTLLVMLSGMYGKKADEGVTIDMKLTHQNIADMTGITRETVTRILNKWQKGGQLSVLKNKYIHLTVEFLKPEFTYQE
jgi:CRP/FNR family cyclic AMP-dependent transcriptional regulator